MIIYPITIKNDLYLCQNFDASSYLRLSIAWAVVTLPLKR